MSIIRSTQYPGRWNVPDSNSPQGSGKNRTSPTSNDGSYFDEGWFNDMDSLNQALFIASGITPNGTQDVGTASQIFDALINNRWSEIGNYSIGTIVKASDGNQYYCNKVNGRDTVVSDPTSDSLDNWRQYPFKKVTNSNGTAIMHYNGDMECRAIVSDPSQSQRVDFAATFTTGPLMTMGTDTQEATDIIGRFKSKDATGFTVSLTGASATPFALNYVAIGSWI